MAQQLFYFILFLNNNIIITSNKIMWGITRAVCVCVCVCVCVLDLRA